MFGKIFPSSGGGLYLRHARKCIRLTRYGCANRPFYHIVVMLKRKGQHEQPIEQLGTFDIMPNERNEKLVSFNFGRIQYWLGQGSDISKPVAELLGLSGFLPAHPRTYMRAWRNRYRLQNASSETPTEEVKENKQTA